MGEQWKCHTRYLVTTKRLVLLLSSSQPYKENNRKSQRRKKHRLFSMIWRSLIVKTSSLMLQEAHLGWISSLKRIKKLMMTTTKILIMTAKGMRLKENTTLLKLRLSICSSRFKTTLLNTHKSKLLK